MYPNPFDHNIRGNLKTFLFKLALNSRMKEGRVCRDDWRAGGITTRKTVTAFECRRNFACVVLRANRFNAQAAEHKVFMIARPPTRLGPLNYMALRAIFHAELGSALWIYAFLGSWKNYYRPEIA